MYTIHFEKIGHSNFPKTIRETIEEAIQKKDIPVEHETNGHPFIGAQGFLKINYNQTNRILT